MHPGRVAADDHVLHAVTFEHGVDRLGIERGEFVRFFAGHEFAGRPASTSAIVAS